MRRLGLVLVGGIVVACRDPAPAADAGPAASQEPVPSASVEPRHAEDKPEAGVLINPLCEGMNLSLFEMACEVTNAEWAQTPAPEPNSIAQEAKLDRRKVEFALVNKSTKPVALALRFDDRNPGKSISVIAEAVGGQGIYALTPPKVTLIATPSSGHLHSTRIKLPPRGRATAQFGVDWTPTERLDKRGALDAGSDAGAPKPLQGDFTLHIGQLFSPAEMGEPATLRLSNGLSK